MDLPLFSPFPTARILETLLALTQDAVVIAGLDGNVMSWSRGAERMFGFSAAEMLDRSIFTIIPDERRGEFDSMLAQVREGVAIENFPTTHRTGSGSLLDALVSAVPVRGDNGSITSVLIVAKDVTAQRRADAALMESQARWRAVVDSAVDGIIVIDGRGKIGVFNPAAERLFGYSEQEVVGQNVNVLMPSPYHEEHDGYIADYLRTGHQKVIGIGREVTAQRRDGSTFPVHLAVGEMAVGSERHFTGILHDLTPRVQLEERVREQTTLARLGEMAAVIAHEVKNPLAAVRGAIQVVGQRLPTESTDRPVIKEIVARIDALDDLIKDLLLFARTPQPRLTQVDLSSLLQLTAEFLSADPAMRALRVDIAGTASPVAGDPELLRIVFQNLLLNAGQAMQRVGTTTVRLSSEGQLQRVTVADTGPGLSSDARANLFRPFFTTKSRGTGLGLPTAKRLVELHGGSISVDSIAGEGTTVTVRLPVVPPATPDARA